MGPDCQQLKSTFCGGGSAKTLASRVPTILADRATESTERDLVVSLVFSQCHGAFRLNVLTIYCY